MAYRYGDRAQAVLLPACIEDYVRKDAPVRAYDVMVESMDLAALRIDWNPEKVGCPQYSPKAMLKLLVYGYAYGIRSSRKLERETHYNLSFIWLMGGLRPDHKTISEFRRRNKRALRRVIGECARICLRLGLIEGNTFFVDGSKIRANASLKSDWTEGKCEGALRRIDERIEEILRECEEEDEKEAEGDSLVRMREELADARNLKERVKRIWEELKETGESSKNTTDPDCTRVRGRQGSHAGYNGQIVVDEKEGLIVESDVVNQNHDLGQLGERVEQANKTLGERCERVCGDAGFAEYTDLEKMEGEGIDVIVPSRSQAEGKTSGAFDKSAFVYEEERDAYRCPEGHWLRLRETEEARRRKVYRGQGSVCRRCRHFGVCTTAQRNGRQITRYLDEAFRERLAQRYESEQGQAIYRKRKEKVELPFGHIKRNLGAGHFLLRGLAGVQAEMSLLSTCFNIARMITIMGVGGLIAQLGG
jgi:transposase